MKIDDLLQLEKAPEFQWDTLPMAERGRLSGAPLAEVFEEGFRLGVSMMEDVREQERMEVHGA